MKELIELLESYSIEQVLIFFIIFALVIFGVYEFIKKCKGVLDDYYNRRKTLSNRDDEINSRFLHIETIQNEHATQINDIRLKLNDLNENIMTMKEAQERNNLDQKKVARAQAKSTMTRLADEILAQGYATDQQNEVITEICNIYMQSSTDNYIVPARVSKALHMEVLSDEEIERMKRKNGDNKTSGRKAFRRMSRR